MASDNYTQKLIFMADVHQHDGPAFLRDMTTKVDKLELAEPELGYELGNIERMSLVSALRSLADELDPFTRHNE